MPTAKEYLERDVAQSLLGDAQWVEPITHFPRGDRRNGQPLSGFLDTSEEQGSNQVQGDGPVMESAKGKRIRRTGKLDLPAGVAVQMDDTFFVAGELWSLRRHLGRDQGRQTLLVVVVEGDFTRQPDIRQT